MKATSVPQGPWMNPEIAEGEYEAKIVTIKKGYYGPAQDLYLQVILWLKQPECYLVTNLYFPAKKPDSKTVQRLSRLSQICGLAPQDALDSPKDFAGAELKVRVKRVVNQGREYCDVDRFLHLDD